MKTYTQDEVKALVEQALKPFTSETTATKTAARLFEPKMHKAYVEDLGNGVFRLSAEDDNGVEWQVIDVSARGVFFHRNINDDTGWQTDFNGEMALVKNRSEL